MFLAIKEILFSKTKYVLIIVVILLSTYLTMFLTGLSYGLAFDNRSAVDAWNASGIILDKDSNNSIAMSFINQDAFDSVNATSKARLRAMPGIIRADDINGESVNAYLFGVDTNEFIVPSVDSGVLFSKPFEIVVDDSLRTKNNYAIGDKIQLSNMDQELTIVGFVKDHKFNTAPVIYLTLEDIASLTQMPTASLDADSINAIIFKGNVSYNQDQLKSLTIPEFINEIPGYRPQVLTFGLMIGFLIGIIAFVLGIFIYVLTIQKTNMFGIMKAQGIRTKTIVWSVLSQVLVLTAIGVGIGLALTFITVLFLPSAVPFKLDLIFSVGIVGLIFLFSIIGGMFSIRSVTKVDPLIAMGV